MASNKKEVQKRSDEKRAGKRARAWTAVVYPDSAPENWQEILADQLVECLISPLHDKDIEPTGEIKKAHYHLVLSFKNPTGFDKAKEVFKAVNAVIPPEFQSRVKDFKQMARYLCHLDQPNKHRYEISDVVSIGAIDYAMFVMSAADEDALLDEICDFIDTHAFISFSKFCRYVRLEKPEWRQMVYHKCSFFIREYMKALHWEILNENQIDEVAARKVMKDLKDIDEDAYNECVKNSRPKFGDYDD